jgi:ElaB/YqjD/DUF883 family membrane-anchored ribosome-binding protein
MTTASTTANTMRDIASEGARDVRKASSQASGDIQADLQALREDFGRLAKQVGDIVASKGNAAWGRARSSVDNVLADAQGKGREAAGAMREVSDNFIDAIDESVKTRPYATLAIVAAIGFLLGATWRH